MTKKHFFIFLFLCLFLFLFSACKDDAKARFDEVEDFLDWAYGENGFHKNVYGDIDLPTKIEDVMLEWKSDDPDTLSNDGQVKRREEDVEVNLTVKMEYRGKTREVQYKVIVKALRYYTITFNSMGGSEVHSITRQPNYAITKPADPTREGYVFLGWFEEGTDAEFVFSTMPERNVSLYAKWEKIAVSYTITFDSTGGSAVESITAEADEPITKPEDPVREGYNFLGWYEAGSDEEFDFTTMPERDVTLYARWEKIVVYYTINFDSAGGSAVQSITAEAGTQIVEPADPVRDGYIFLGWYEDGSDEEYVFATMPERNVTLYARWEEIIKYTITFDSAGGSAVQSITAEAGTQIVKPADPVRDGYIFLGWYEDGLDEEYVFTAMPERNVTLYARWEEYIDTFGFEFILKEDGTYEVAGYTGYETELIIPGEHNGIPVTSIGRYAFSYSADATSIVIPEGVTRIGEGAFAMCSNLTNISLPEGLTTIRDYAFLGCSSLKTVILPENLTVIGPYGFHLCTNLMIYAKAPSKPSGWSSYWNTGRPVYFGVDEIRESSGMQYLIIDGSITITRYAGNETELVLPSEIDGLAVTAIGDRAFEGNTKLTSIIIPEGLINIGEYAFENCGNLVVYAKAGSKPAGWDYLWNPLNRPVYFGVEEISEFNGLHYAVIDGSITITRYAGTETALEVPAEIEEYQVTGIGPRAFEFCPELKSIILPESLISVGAFAFNKYGNFVIYVKVPSMTEGWSDDWNPFNRPVYFGVDEVLEYNGLQYLIIDGTITITKYVGTEPVLTIPSEIEGYQVTSIGERAFEGCDYLKTVTLPECIEYIGDLAFGYCSDLVVFAEAALKPSGWSDEWKSLDTPVYYGVEEVLECNGLQYIVADGNVTITKYLGSEATLEIPALIDGHQVTRIGDKAFKACESLTDITLPEGLTGIGDYAFMDCGNLKSITLPKTLKSMGAAAFQYCNSLKTIVLPKSLNIIGDYAFFACNHLKIFAEASSKPTGWSEKWKDSNTAVVWGHKLS